MAATQSATTGAPAESTASTANASSPPPPPPSTPPAAALAKSIVVSPPELTLTVGQTVQPNVAILDADNRTIAGRRAVWVSPNAAVATVDRTTGAITGVAVGTTDIRATSGSARGTIRVRVEAPVVLASVSVDQPRRLTVGDNLTLSATARDTRGNVMPGQTVTWSSADPKVATVEAGTGVVTATGAGSTDITASVGGKSTTVRLSVAAPAPPPPPVEVPKTPAVDPAAEERRARAAIESAVQDYVAALRAHDARRVASVYRAESDQDRKNEQALGRLMEGAAKLTAAEPNVHATRIDGAAASTEFAVPMTWRNPFGRIREQTVTFRADLTRDGSEWKIAGARVVGVLTP